MRLGKRLEIDAETASQTYYACLLFYVGCTANADIAAEIFGDHSALTTYGAPVRFGSRPEMVAGLMRAVAPPGNAPLVRARQLSCGLPRLARVLKGQRAAVCEVAQMLTDRLGLPTAIGALFTHVDDRWDGKGEPGRAKREAIPLPVRIVQVARDAALQRMLGGSEYAASAIRERAGRAFDPVIARRLADEAAEILALDEQTSAWDETLACEPTPRLTLVGEANDRALAAMGDFADLASPYLVGHPGGVAELATKAARRCGSDPADLTRICRAALVHDVGRIASTSPRALARTGDEGSHPGGARRTTGRRCGHRGA